MEYTRNFRNCRDKNFGAYVAVPEKEKTVVPVEVEAPVVAAPKKEKKAKKEKAVVEESEPKPPKGFLRKFLH